jgi:hypothetical protein
MSNANLLDWRLGGGSAAFDMGTVHQMNIRRAMGGLASREDMARYKRKWTRMHLKYKVKDIIKIQSFRLSERVDPNLYFVKEVTRSHLVFVWCKSDDFLVFGHSAPGVKL